MMLCGAGPAAKTLIPNPVISAVLKELLHNKVNSFPAVNTLFNGLANHPTSTLSTGRI
jgi:long-chain acyl-CoA synthetase